MPVSSTKCHGLMLSHLISSPWNHANREPASISGKVDCEKAANEHDPKSETIPLVISPLARFVGWAYIDLRGIALSTIIQIF